MRSPGHFKRMATIVGVQPATTKIISLQLSKNWR